MPENFASYSSHHSTNAFRREGLAAKLLMINDQLWSAVAENMLRKYAVDVPAFIAVSNVIPRRFGAGRFPARRRYDFVHADRGAIRAFGLSHWFLNLKIVRIRTFIRSMRLL